MNEKRICAVGHFCRSKNKISVSVEEIVAGECGHKLLVPQRREMLDTEEGMFITSTLSRIASTVSPAMPAFNTVEAGKIEGNWGQTFPCFL